MKVKPFELPKFNKIEIVNEAGILLVSDCMLVICNPIVEGEAKKILGYCVICLCGSIVAGNFGVMVQDLLAVTLPEAKIKAERGLRKLKAKLWSSSYLSEKKKMHGYAMDDWFYEKGLMDAKETIEISKERKRLKGIHDGILK